VTVRFDVKAPDDDFFFALYGQDVRLCQRRSSSDDLDHFLLELLPGEYELYAGTNDPLPYTVTLTEQPTVLTHAHMTLSPGFKEINARGILLNKNYKNGPLAQFHELTVTEPMLIEFTARKVSNYKRDDNKEGHHIFIEVTDSNGNFVSHSNSESHSDLGDIANAIIPLRPGQYKIRVANQQASIPGPYNLNVRENTRLKIPQHITLDQRFNQTAFEGAWVAGRAVRNDGRFRECFRDKNWDCLDISSPHKLVVTVPRMVGVWAKSMKNRVIRERTNAFDAHGMHVSFVLLRTSGETKVFCKNGRKRITAFGSKYEVEGDSIDAFLVPGEYEIYIISKPYNQYSYGYDAYAKTTTVQYGVDIRIQN